MNRWLIASIVILVAAPLIDGLLSPYAPNTSLHFGIGWGGGALCTVCFFRASDEVRGAARSRRYGAS